MRTQSEWQASVEAHVAAITQSQDRQAAGRIAEPTVRWAQEWTERDALLSDALHAYDVALGLDKPWVADAVDFDDEGDPAFLANYKAERGWESHIAHERAIETFLKRNDPPLTSDANKTHDPSPAARRWSNGAACQAWIELEHQADVQVTVEPIREELAHVESVIESCEPHDYIADLEAEREQLRFDLILAMEGEKVHPLPSKGRSGKRACPHSFVKRSGESKVSTELTAPTPERLRSYAVTFFAQRYGAQSLRFGAECSPTVNRDLWANTGWTAKGTHEAVLEDLDTLRSTIRTKRGLSLVQLRDGRAVTVRAKVKGAEHTAWRNVGTAAKPRHVRDVTCADREQRALQARAMLKAANRDLMPLQRPIHTPLPARLEPWEYMLVTRIRAGFRMVAYKRGVYVPTDPRKTVGPQQRVLRPSIDGPKVMAALRSAR